MKKIVAILMTATTLFAAPQAIVFDFGGVMTGAFKREVVVDFLRGTLQLSPAEFEQANQEKRKALKDGKTDEEFWQAFAKQKGVVLNPDWSARFKGAIREALSINDEMFALVEQLKGKQIPVGMLSNIDERLAGFLRECGFYEPFDPCVLSYEIGVEKPDPKAYDILLEALDLPASQVVFIDDLPENVASAKAQGLDAILFESTEQIQQHLKERKLL